HRGDARRCHLSHQRHRVRCRVGRDDALTAAREPGRLDQGMTPLPRSAGALIAAVGCLMILTSGASGAPATPWPSLLGSRDALPPEVSAAVDRVWFEPTLSRTVNGRPAHVPLDVYVAFLDTPEVTAAAARFRKLGSYEIRVLDGDRYWGSDGDGASGTAHVLRREPRRLVLLSRGEHSAPILGTVSGSALTILDLEPREDVVNPRLTAYLHIDNRAAAAMARALIPSFGFLADRKLGEGLRVTAEVAEWAIEPSGGFCDWFAREPFPTERRDRIIAVLPSCVRTGLPRDALDGNASASA